MNKRTENSRKKDVTTADVARQVNVSQGVASMVLNGGTGNIRVGAATRKRILETAEKLGYRANSAARAMKTGKFNSVGLLFSVVPNYSLLSAQCLDGLLEALEARDMHLTMARIPDEELTDTGAVPKLLGRLYADGILVIYNARVPKAFGELADHHHMPTVWINSKHKTDSVYPNDREAARLLTRRLLDAGWEEIVFLNDIPKIHYSVGDRFKGYSDAMKKAGLKPREVPIELKNGLSNEIKAFLSKERRRQAFVSYSPDLSDRLFACAEDLGLMPGKDLAVGTFSLKPYVWHRAEFPTALLPDRQIAFEAVDMLLKKIEHSLDTFPSVAVPFG